ncbi:MAG TPA: metallophosphoesterase [Gemmatimonadaceae bacterium]|nr:metallophosphoesterase [Gemmatimonadaceae bacterium]
MNRRRFLAGSAALLGAGLAGTGAYAWLGEPFWIEVVERPLPVEALPDALIGARLIQISDIHVGPYVDGDYLLRALRMVAELEPDLLVITGDLITWRAPEHMEALRRLLASLPRAPLGTVAVLGNHDYGRGWRNGAIADGVTAALEEVGVTVLRNATSSVAGITFAGVDDLWSPNFRLDETLATPLAPPSIVLCHNPDGADRPGWGDFRGWILAGHTHGGQVRAPFRTSPFLPVRNERYDEGEFALAGGRRMYINRGLGYHLQLRLLVRPEITVFTLGDDPRAGQPTAAAQ